MRKTHQALSALLVMGGLTSATLLWRQAPSFEGQDPHYREGPIVGEHTPLAPKPSQAALHTPLQPSLSAQALSAPSQKEPNDPTPDQGPLPAPSALPPLPQGDWSIKERGALAAPMTLVREALTRDFAWSEEPEGEGSAWRHITGGATLSLSEQREERLTGVTLRFEREGGGSAIIPPLEALLLGAGEPSMLRWERHSGEPAPPVAGKLTHRDAGDQAGERSVYYYCEYPPPQGDEPLLPHTCHFTLEPHPQALKLGETLQPSPSF